MIGQKDKEMENMSKKKRTLVIAMVIILVIVLAYVGLGSYRIQRSEAKARAVVEAMTEVIPDLSEGGRPSEGLSAPELKTMEVSGYSVVGCLYIPKLELAAPVAESEVKEMAFTYVYGETSSGEGIRICGTNKGIYGRITELKEGDPVYFIDLEGLRYEYIVSNKSDPENEENEANDLTLCYVDGGSVEKVAGCSKN